MQRGGFEPVISACLPACPVLSSSRLRVRSSVEDVSNVGEVNNGPTRHPARGTPMGAVRRDLDAG